MRLFAFFLFILGELADTRNMSAHRSQRYRTREKAAVEIYGKDGVYLSDVKNLSQTGALLEWSVTDVGIKEGDFVRVTVVLNNLGKKHNVNAQVVWVEGRKSGIQFLKEKELLNKILERSA